MDSLRRLIGLVHVAAVVVVAGMGLIQSTGAATTHVVGDTTGWTIPSTSQFYNNWASGKTFRVGDILSFNFNAMQHDVAEVTKADYDACISNNTIGSIINSSPANITLNSTGNHYYLCAFTGHCDAGQKLAVNVVSSTASAPSSPPSASPSPSPTQAVSPSTPSPAPAVPGSGPSPLSPGEVAPSPAQISPTAPSGPSPSPTASSGPSPSPPASSSPPSPSPTASSGPPSSSSGSPSSPPTVPSSGPPTSPPNTPSPPAPSAAFSLRTTSGSMAVSIAILLSFFI